jgi:hypothetical protein
LPGTNPNKLEDQPKPHTPVLFFSSSNWKGRTPCIIMVLLRWCLILVMFFSPIDSITLYLQTQQSFLLFLLVDLAQE